MKPSTAAFEPISKKTRESGEKRAYRKALDNLQKKSADLKDKRVEFEKGIELITAEQEKNASSIATVYQLLGEEPPAVKE